MANNCILIVDDDKNIVDLVQTYLKKDNYRVLTAYNGLRALELARQKRPDLIVLDLMLPGMDGLDVCRVLRAEGHNMPIIMLTAKTTEMDKLVGLDLGADDYVTKPFSPRELLARIRAALRRVGEQQRQSPSVIHFGDLEVDFVRHETRVLGKLANLTPKEFKLLEVLIKEPGRAFSEVPPKSCTT